MEWLKVHHILRGLDFVPYIQNLEITRSAVFWVAYLIAMFRMDLRSSNWGGGADVVYEAAAIVQEGIRGGRILRVPQRLERRALLETMVSKTQRSCDLSESHTVN